MEQILTDETKIQKQIKFKTTWTKEINKGGFVI